MWSWSPYWVAVSRHSPLCSAGPTSVCYWCVCGTFSSILLLPSCFSPLFFFILLPPTLLQLLGGGLATLNSTLSQLLLPVIHDTCDLVVADLSKVLLLSHPSFPPSSSHHPSPLSPKVFRSTTGSPVLFAVSTHRCCSCSLLAGVHNE